MFSHLRPQMAVSYTHLFPIKNILDSLREDVQNGTITLSQAAEELHRAGWSNYIDEDTARRLLKL